MPRRNRLNLIGQPLHVQRGNNRAACFFAEEDYRFYLHWLAIYAKQYGCAVSIRTAANTGRVLGDDRFRGEIAVMTSKRLSPG